jgi:hypothetical protein
MVARILNPSNIRRPLNYNEKKVEKGCAELIHGSGYLKDLTELNFHEKLEGFTRLIERNNSKTNSLHISLNFANTDQLDKEKLIQIADDYMDRIGFGSQPYLVYQHNDAGHPHVHIVTTTIKADGKRIDTFRIGANKSETARKEIEIAYGLTKAENSKIEESFKLKPVQVEKALYGKSETKRAILNVLEAVLKKYNYTSLPELNALLQQYNIRADRGGEDSQSYRHHGLLYQLLNEQGKPVGMRIKASDFYSEPTLPNLEQLFSANKESPARIKNKQKLVIALKLALLNAGNVTLSQLMTNLQKQGIQMVLRKNATGLVYGITYVDHRNKTVFNGSDLDTRKQFSAKGILAACRAEPDAEMIRTTTLQQTSDESRDLSGIPVKNESSSAVQKKQATEKPRTNFIHQAAPADSHTPGMLDILMQNEYSNSELPFELRRTRRKKKRRRKN